MISFETDGFPSKSQEPLIHRTSKVDDGFTNLDPCLKNAGARLELRGEAPSEDRLWLRGALHLVALRLRELCEEEPGGPAKHWLDLQRSMPGSAWKLLRASCPAVDRVGREAERPGPADEGARHGAEGLPGRETEVEATLQEAAASLEAGDADRMLGAVIAVVAMLSAPREAAARGEGAETMAEAALERLRAAQQSRLREALLRLLDEGLDLSDPGTLRLLRPPLGDLSSLLHSRCLSGVAHAEQWLALARVVGDPRGHGGATLPRTSSSSSGPLGLRTQERKTKKSYSERLVSNKDNSHGSVKKVALAAMANLGGRATMKQLRHEILRMPESSTLSKVMSPVWKALSLSLYIYIYIPLNVHTLSLHIYIYIYI